MTTPHHRCPCCRGTGRVQLTGVYADTWHLLHSNPGGISGAALAHAAGCRATAMNNRLAALERHGLATSRRDGRRRLFCATEGNP